jgi:type IV pilus assembly protein PilP
MVTWLRYSLWIALAFRATVVVAQEEVATPSQKTKEAVDKLRGAPGAIGKSLRSLGDTAEAYIRDAVAVTKSTQANPGASAPAEEKPDQPSASGISTFGRRDPFRPYTLTGRSTGRPRQNLSPLERYDLGQLKLVGVVWHVKEPNAVIEDSVGLGYIIKVGTPIGANEGKVKAIKPNEVIVEEAYVDLFGAKKTREVSIKLSMEKTE